MNQNAQEMQFLRGHIAHTSYPHPRGAIYLAGTNKVDIKKASFTKNDCGPILERNQILGLVHNKDGSGSNSARRALAIFVGDSTGSVSV